MTFIALLGDCTTTTTLALAGAMSSGDDVLVVEADRTGGSVAAWLDAPVSPSLSTVVASLRGISDDSATTWTAIDALIRRSRSGVRFLPAPVRSVEAFRAVEEAEPTIFPTIARWGYALVDTGRRAAVDGISRTLSLADIVVVCHRQAAMSAAAAGVRMERTAELVEVLSGGSGRIIVAVIGDQPFELGEIGDFLESAAEPRPIAPYQLPEDVLAAAVLAGRQGVSQKRFARLPLIRSCRGLAELIGTTATGPATAS